HHLQHRFKAHLLVLNILPQDAAKNLGDLLIRELDRAKKWVDLAAMCRRAFQNPHDHAGLVLGGNRSMLAGAQWDMHRAGPGHGRMMGARYSSHSAKYVGLRCATASPDQSKSRSDNQ